MIYFLVTAKHSYTMQFYLTDWAPEMRWRIEIVEYESLAGRRTYAAGTYIFGDLERLTAPQLAHAALVCQTLKRAGFTVLNDPGRTLRRYELGRRMFELGVNEFNVYRLAEVRTPRRFPVFLRLENEHKVASRLLHSKEHLDDGIRRAAEQGYSVEQLLMVEFCDTSDEQGIYRSYSAFLIGDRVIPRQLFAGSTWKLKSPELRDEETRRLEQQFIAANPHEDWIRMAFAEAGAEYGKIDYGLSAGRPQAWEVNTNPTVVWPRWECPADDVPMQEEFSRAFSRALDAVDYSPSRVYGVCIAGAAGI
jgi:hypothetical protein